jgi:hypothetical protein
MVGLYTEEKGFEACALKLHNVSINLLILCIYRSPFGDFTIFLNQLDHVLIKLFKISTDIVLCGHFNINFLVKSPRLLLLETLLASFSLISTIQFTTRNVDDSQTLIDNIFINKNVHKFEVYPLLNGLSDHDAQMMVLLDVKYFFPKKNYSYYRQIDHNSINNF